MDRLIDGLLIVEDDGLLRNRLIETLRDVTAPDRLFACASLAEARQLQASHLPKIILLDVGLPDGNGLELLVDQHALSEPPLVVILTGFSDEETIVKAIRLGARGYLLKQDSGTSISQALQQIVDGIPPLSPSVAQCIMTHIRDDTPSADKPGVLPPRQQLTLKLLARGLTYREIAEDMEITFNTVSTYAQEIYNKLAVRSRGEAVHKAREMGII
ncbi:MAG: response regulator transcription factor [Xanthomonadales bacterium]|nr:response regulator transcription factor [Xanthomonadales bacterium]